MTEGAKNSRAKKPARQKPAETVERPGNEPPPREDEPELYDRVQQRAYEIWESEGRPDGREEEHWQRAEHEVLRELAAVPDRGSAREDTTGAVAAPGGPTRRGASGSELGGTPSATETSSGGRQTPSGRRKTVTRT